jgi:hypothetical protein
LVVAVLLEQEHTTQRLLWVETAVHRNLFSTQLAEAEALSIPNKQTEDLGRQVVEMLTLALVVVVLLVKALLVQQLTLMAVAEEELVPLQQT